MLIFKGIECTKLIRCTRLQLMLSELYRSAAYRFSIFSIFIYLFLSVLKNKTVPHRCRRHLQNITNELTTRPYQKMPNTIIGWFNYFPPLFIYTNRHKTIAKKYVIQSATALAVNLLLFDAYFSSITELTIKYCQLYCLVFIIIMEFFSIHLLLLKSIYSFLWDVDVFTKRVTKMIW